MGDDKIELYCRCCKRSVDFNRTDFPDVPSWVVRIEHDKCNICDDGDRSAEHWLTADGSEPDPDTMPMAGAKDYFELVAQRDTAEKLASDKTAIADDLYAALVEAKRELWDHCRVQWTRADFKNFSVIQQIDAALTAADGKDRS